MKNADNRDLRISVDVRKKTDYLQPLFNTEDPPVVFHRVADELAHILNVSYETGKYSSLSFYLIGVLHSAYQDVITHVIKTSKIQLFKDYTKLNEKNATFKSSLKQYDRAFPTKLLKNQMLSETLRSLFVYYVITSNPAIIENAEVAFKSDEFNIEKDAIFFLSSFLPYQSVSTKGLFKKNDIDSLFDFLNKPSILFPTSLEDQLSYILEHWKEYLSENVLKLLKKARDYISEFRKPHFTGSGKPQFKLGTLDGIEAYTEDRDWMPNVVMIAKNALVWLSQLSKKYNRSITHLDEIPDEELIFLRDSGFNALWLIGVWERSPASKRIKCLCGNSDAESSAYSLYEYRIADRLGGQDSLHRLKERLSNYHIRLCGDMVPNHTGIDSPWVIEHPEYFISQSYSPFASYTYNGEDLSSDPNVEIKIEDHYFNKSDCAVTFLRRDKNTGETRFIFHGNDGTSMPWNDTAQLNYLNKDVREAVIGVILRVARDFPIIRFDAAMTLAMKHIRRLWYPEEGHAGDIPGRADHTMSDEEFARLMGEEFWKTVVDRVQKEAPNTLLLAEAFWMMEGYFVRSLGLHRVYNSAFMNMLRNEANKEYRDGIKETLAFDPEIMQRYVNFLNNPDEDAAIEGFGDGDKYFGCATLLSTLPGLPMFGHGQLEGFREKYGMEFSSPKWDETPNYAFLDAHKTLIFPLLKKRRCFSGTKAFELFDLVNEHGGIEENVYAYANGMGPDKVFVFYNNSYSKANGRVTMSVSKNTKENGKKTLRNVSFINALNLERGNDKFMLYQTLNDKLYHIYPISKIEKEGFWIDLNGFETQVFENIRTLTDRFGIYARFFEKFGRRGVEDINDAGEDLMFSSLYSAMAPLLDESYFASIATLLKTSSPKAQKTLTTLLRTTYDAIKSELKNDDFFSSYREFNTESTLEMVKKWLKGFQLTRKKMPLFLDGALSVIPNKEELYGTLMVILPFLDKIKDSDELLLFIRSVLRFFTYRFKKEDGAIDRERMERIKWYAYLMLETRKLPDDIKALLENSEFTTLIKLNEYEGTLYFDLSRFKEVSTFKALSDLMFKVEGDRDVIRIVDSYTLLYSLSDNTRYDYNTLKENYTKCSEKDEDDDEV